MSNSRKPVDDGVSVSIPQGYSYQQIETLARAIYQQFFSDHERYCYRLNPDHSRMTVFSVN